MSVAILIISHNQIGQTMFDTVASLMEQTPLATQIMSISPSCNPDDVVKTAKNELARLDQGEGVLVLTDMFGSTPSNIACELIGNHVEIVTGLNLPMLVRVMNYPQLGLRQLVQKALSGGQEGVMECQLIKKTHVKQGSYHN